MAFTSLQKLLGSLEHQDRWKGQRQFQQLLACWSDVVGEAVAAQTRPVSIQRRVLYVATSSAVWAQNLSFERLRIVEKLNARLPVGVTDIRFSTAHWQGDTPHSRPPLSEAALLWQNHPSRAASAASTAGPESADPQTAFRQWARTMRTRLQHLPLCPSCQSPTPLGELQRWSVCSLCAAQQMGGERAEPDREPAAEPKVPYAADQRLSDRAP